LPEVLYCKESLKIRPKEEVQYETGFISKSLVSVKCISVTGIKNNSDVLQQGAIKATLYNDGLSSITIKPNTPLLEIEFTKEVPYLESENSLGER